MLKKLWYKLFPQKRLTWYNQRYEVTSIAQYMDVDYVSSILEEAQAGDTTLLFALYRDILISDSHLQGEFTKRKLSLLGDSLSILPIDKKNPDDVAAARLVEDVVQGCSGWTAACSHLMDSTLYPVAVVEKVFKPSRRPGIRFELAELVPVPPRLLSFVMGRLQIYKTLPDTGSVSGERMEIDPSRYIIHRGHLLTSPDWWGGPMRSLVFWWLFKNMSRDWWANFLERFGAPFIVSKYNQGDDESRRILETALKAATKIFGLVISTDTQVELMQAATSQTGEAFEKFHDVCNKEISKLIIGQTTSAEAKPTGLNSGVSKSHDDVREDFRKFDSTSLGATYRDQLFQQILDINGQAGTPPRAVWGGEDDKSEEALGSLLESLAKSGLQVSDNSLSSLSERIGLELQRAPVPAALPSSGNIQPMAALSPRHGIRVFSADKGQRLADQAQYANDAVAKDGAATLALAFRGSLAPIRRIILNSSSPQQVEEEIKAFYADWSPERVAPLVQEALTAYGANGAAMGGK